MSEEPKIRTPNQNRALHGWLTSVADCLNDHGKDMRVVLKPSVDIPWTGKAAKEYLWSPIQEAMFAIGSSTELETSEVSQVVDMVSMHIAQKIGVTLPPFPSVENGGGKQDEYGDGQ
jgi:hypothetical protein